MLELLTRYAWDHRLVVEPGFAPKTVRWCLSFASDGRFLGVNELGEVGSKKNPGREFPVCPDLPSNVVAGGSTQRSHFLIETAQVVALLFKDEADERDNGFRVQGKREFFLDLLNQASDVIPSLCLVSRSLVNGEVLSRVRLELSESKAKPQDKVTIAIDSQYPVESDAWHDWWRGFRSSLTQGSAKGEDRNAGSSMRCFATGAIGEPLPTHPKIKGLSDVGGIAMGDVLIGFDKDAFTSYGLSQSANCAVCESAAYAYQAALNNLVSSKARTLCGTKVTYWYKDEVDPADDWLSWMIAPSLESHEASASIRAAELLDSVRKGQRPELLNNYFYAVTISGAGGRVMVRDWMDGRFEDLVESAGKWFTDLEITGYFRSTPAKDPGIERLVTSLLPPKGREQKYSDWVKPVQPQARVLWNAALRKDAEIPHSALTRVILLNTRFVQTGKLEEALERGGGQRASTLSLLYARMAVIKAYHIRKNGGNELTAYLNEDHPSAAYQCGRIMAILRRIQWAAQGNVGANVVQRYYAAASSTPALVLPRIIRLSQHHIGKIGGTKPGLAKWYTDRLAEVWSKINRDIQRSLSLEEQSLFALGYYQQIAFDNASRPEKVAGLTDDEISNISKIDDTDGEENINE